MIRENLLVNGLQHPYGVDGEPVFGWKIKTDSYGSAQTAYQVIVCSTVQKAEMCDGDLWDSGKTESETPFDIVYKGEKLSSKTTYFWRVQTWDEKGVCSGWSSTSSFTTGILQPQEWQAEWIGAGSLMPAETVEKSPMSCSDETKFSRRVPLLRKTFEAGGGIKEAKLFISGLGLFEVKINGQRPDDSVLNPGNTQYTRTVPYRAFDVTELVRDGKNVISTELGNGFFNEHTGVWKWQTAKWRDNPKLLLHLDLCYADGQRQTVVSDTDWKVYVDGPTVKNSIYLGETYDANREVPGWEEAEFDDSAWENAQKVSAPAGKLVCQTMPPVKRIFEKAAKSIEKTASGAWVAEVPETISGWAKIRMKAAKGQKITVTYGEQRNEDGTVVTTGNDQGCCGEWWPEGILQQDFYISDGTERFWEPKFTYKGFRYIQIDDYEGELTCEDVICFCLGNEMAQSSQFSCSDPLIEKLHDMMQRTMRNNFLWKPTDTPVWEKNGWLGDANVAILSMFYQYDMQHMMKNFVEIMRDCQQEFGLIPCMVPSADWWTHENQPVWNTVFVFAAEFLYDMYGELETLRRWYPDLKVFAQKNIAECREQGWTWYDAQLADWVAPMGDTMLETVGDSSEGAAICGTAFIYMMLASMCRISELVGAQEDTAKWQQARECIFDAFQKRFYKPEEKLYDTGFRTQVGMRRHYRQSSVLVPAAAKLIPDENKQAVIERLVQDIHEKEDHLDTGCVGTRYILPVLADHGYEDLAWRILKQDTYPSWGYWVKNDTDCMWEGWEFASRSRDHYFLGTCDEFFYTHICGIRSIKDGCRNICIEPVFYPQLTHAAAKIDTVRGDLTSAWKREPDGRICLQVSVPCGAQAQIVVPDDCLEVKAGSEGICRTERNGKGKVILTAVSGDYTFYMNIQEGLK